MKRTKAMQKSSPRSLVGKTVAVSGATGGLGRELCKRLCELGASLILLDRNKERSLALIGELSLNYPEAKLEHITVDLEDITRVREVASELSLRELDYLVLNAGAYAIPRRKCDTGYDNVFQINFVSPYYLARKLLPSIKSRGGKVVAVSSIAHGYSRIDTDDVDFSTRRAASKVYGNAKRYLTFALLPYANDRAVAIVHPGIAVTNITAHYPKLVYALIKYPMKLIFMSPAKASLSVLSGIFTEHGDDEWIGPRLFDIWGLPKKKRIASRPRKCSQSERETIIKIAESIYNAQ